MSVTGTSAILWRRLESPGHDACRLQSAADGWSLDGAAVYLDDEKAVPLCLVYQVVSDLDWRTREGSVQGWIGSHSVDLRVIRTADGVWLLNDQVVAGLEGCLDLDFGFTPATNLFQVRRVALPIGQSAEVPVAWLDVSAASLTLLHQRYERRSDGHYWYEAPRFDYAAMLEITETGFVTDYPGLWRAEI